MNAALFNFTVGFGFFFTGLYMAAVDEFSIAAFLVSVANTNVIAGYWNLGCK